MNLTNKELLKLGFYLDDFGMYWINLPPNHYLELVRDADCYTPRVSEISGDKYVDDQQVILHRIKTVEELENLIYVITGKNIKEI